MVGKLLFRRSVGECMHHCGAVIALVDEAILALSITRLHMRKEVSMRMEQFMSSMTCDRARNDHCE